MPHQPRKSLVQASTRTDHGAGFAHPRVTRLLSADSAQAFRDNLAHRSDLMSPGVPFGAAPHSLEFSGDHSAQRPMHLEIRGGPFANLPRRGRNPDSLLFQNVRRVSTLL
jgi:hypothetical protein